MTAKERTKMKTTEKFAIRGETTMERYTCKTFNSVIADSMTAAAELFAGRAARREFGKSGYARTCNMGAYSQDGTLAEFSAFIGYTPKGEPHTTQGHNYNFTVQTAG
jgi:hypothetical protein